MYQDSKGRLYFLTFGGLSVYDGARFTNYGLAEGLPIEIVNDVLEITADSIWVATNANKMTCLVKGKIKQLKTADGFCPVINTLVRAADGTIYAGADEGLFVWRENKFIRLPFVYNGKDEGEYFTKIFPAGNFLAMIVNPGYGHNAGSIFLYDVSQQKVALHEKNFTTHNVCQSPDGDVWLSTSRGLRVLKKSVLQQGILRDEDLPDTFASIKDTKAGLLSFDGLGQLWVTSAEGLLFVKPGENPVHYDETSGLASISINNIFHDKEGNTWFLPFGKGAQKLVSNNIEFNDHPFGKSVISDISSNVSSDSIWFYSDAADELFLLAGKLQKKFSLSIPFSGYVIARGPVMYLYNGSQVFRANIPYTGNTLRLTMVYKKTSSNASHAVIDAYGNLIFATESSLKVCRTNDAVYSFDLPFFADQISLDTTGRLWVATRSNNLFVYTLHPESPDKYLQLQHDLSAHVLSKNPRSLVVDRQGVIWIGTRFEGLYGFRLQNNKLSQVHHFTRKEGLSDNFINHLHCDKNNNIWATSYSGLDKIETGKNGPIIKNITGSNHLFMSFRKVRSDKHGTIWGLGDPGTIVKITADKKTNHSFSPLLHIAHMKAGQHSFADIDSAHTFSYQNNSLSFSVAAPSFLDERQIRYSYLLEGSGNNVWSEPSGNSVFNFINLAAGGYTLQVKADFPASSYPSQTINYSFTIEPPWWRTWWFLLIAVAAAVSILVWSIRAYYRQKLEKQKNVLERKQAIEKERARIASDMHDDLGAGLSTLRFLSEKVKRNTFSDVTRKDADNIVVNSNELVQKMNEIIWAMNEKNDTLEDLLFYTRSYAAEYCEENNLECVIHLPEKIPDFFVSGEIRRNVFLTVKESLHNIVKHAEAKKVIIDFNVDSNLSINVKDDGKGLVMKEHTNGNGLRNMQKRIQSIGGNFELIDEKGVLMKMKVPLK